MGKGAEFLFAFLHILGVVTLVGGHMWVSLLMTRAERTGKTDARRFFAENLPQIATLLGGAVLVLFVSGVGRLFLWGDPGMLFLPAPYGWTLLTKLALYSAIVLNGIQIENVRIQRLLSATGEQEFSHQWIRLKQNIRLNFLLVMIVAALGETLSFSQV
jgi:uncharacterized membrane protein